jgi:hypothetical protein
MSQSNNEDRLIEALITERAMRMLENEKAHRSEGISVGYSTHYANASAELKAAGVIPGPVQVSKRRRNT